jgi:hypothetical protein
VIQAHYKHSKVSNRYIRRKRLASVAEGTLPFTGERALAEWKGEVEAAIVEASKGG